MTELSKDSAVVFYLIRRDRFNLRAIVDHDSSFTEERRTRLKSQIEVVSNAQSGASYQTRRSLSGQFLGIKGR